MFDQRHKATAKNKAAGKTTARIPLKLQPVKLTTPPQAALQRHAAAQATLQQHTSRPLAAQRQAAQPVLQAAALSHHEQQRLEGERAPLQRQVAELSAELPVGALASALQRQAQAQAPIQAPRAPTTASDWVSVMRAYAQGIEQKNATSGLNPREAAQHTALQRQVAQVLAHQVRTSPQPAAQRYADFAAQAVALHQHPLTSAVPRAALTLVTPGERPSVQRAVDQALQADALQRAQDEQALNLHALQRQLAELDEQATQPVMQRIQARRGAGNPLPEAIQRHLEQGLNHDLSKVRIHDDAEADKLAKGVNAIAFTTGTDIFFRSGKYAPNSKSGLELLAHEVTHTVQQSQGKVGTGIDPDAGLETEARAMGRKLAHKPIAQFGTRSQRPGQHTIPRQSLQRAASAEPVRLQRWSLGDLKKSFGKNRHPMFKKVTSFVNRGLALKKRIKKNITQAVKFTSKKLSAVKANTKQLVQHQVSKRANSSSNTGYKLPSFKPTSLKGRFTALKQRAKIAVETARRKAQKVIQRGMDTVKRFKAKANAVLHKAEASVKGKVLQALDTVKAKARLGKQKLKQKAQAVGASVTRALRNAKTNVSTFAAKTKGDAKALLSKAGTALKGAKKNAGSWAMKTMKRLPVPLAIAGLGAAATIKGLIEKGPQGVLKGIQTWAKNGYEKLKTPEGKAALVRIGVQIGVGLGAAALTTLTGGLAAPIAIPLAMGIMAAGGAAGNVAGLAAQNAVLMGHGKKLSGGVLHGFSKGQLGKDMAFSALAGPAGAFVGGLARQGAGLTGLAARNVWSARRGAVALQQGRPLSADQMLAMTSQTSYRGLNSQLWAQTKQDTLKAFGANAGLAVSAQSHTARMLSAERQLVKSRTKLADEFVTSDPTNVLSQARRLGLDQSRPIRQLQTDIRARLPYHREGVGILNTELKTRLNSTLGSAANRREIANRNKLYSNIELEDRLRNVRQAMAQGKISRTSVLDARLNAAGRNLIGGKAMSAPIEKVRAAAVDEMTQTPQGISSLNKQLLRQQTRRQAKVAFGRLRRTFIGKPRQTGESALKYGGRVAANALTIGPRAIYNNVMTKNDELVSQLSQKQGIGHMTGAMTSEFVKAGVVGLATKGRFDWASASLEGVMNPLGVPIPVLSGNAGLEVVSGAKTWGSGTLSSMGAGQQADAIDYQEPPQEEQHEGMSP